MTNIVICVSVLVKHVWPTFTCNMLSYYKQTTQQHKWKEIKTRLAVDNATESDNLFVLINVIVCQKLRFVCLFVQM